MSTNDSLKILLLEDEPYIAKLLEFTLKKEGYQCLVVSNGQQGLESLSKYKPDLFLSDIMMPIMDGYEFRKHILSLPEFRSIPFVFLTAKGNDEDILTGYDLEISEYILKTSPQKIIVAKINAIIKNHLSSKSSIIDEIDSASKKIGLKLIPESNPEFLGYEIKHWHQPYQDIPGGDFLDYLRIDDNRIAIILGDIMGKKWNAWYFAYAYSGYIRSTVRTIIQSAPEHILPSMILQKINELVCNDDRIADIYTTLSIIILNKSDNSLYYSGASDLPIIYYSKVLDQTVFLHSAGALLGFSTDSEYNDVFINTESGDIVALCTDGITECQNVNKEMFSIQGLQNVVNDNKESDNILFELKLAISQFNEGDFSDDITTIVIRNLQNQVND